MHVSINHFVTDNHSLRYSKIRQNSNFLVLLLILMESIRRMENYRPKFPPSIQKLKILNSAIIITILSSSTSHSSFVMLVGVQFDTRDWLISTLASQSVTTRNFLINLHKDVFRNGQNTLYCLTPH